MSMIEHAPAAPSSGPRWVVCPGSIRLEALYPEDEATEQAREGTAAHWAVAEVLNGRAVAEGQVTDAGFVLTAEMVEAAEDVLRWVHRMIAQHGGEQPQVFIEHRVACNRIHRDCWGTLDLSLYFPIAQVLYIADFKFGHGWVEVFENWQLLCYLAGMLEFLGVSGTQNDTLRVVLTIIQPRAWHPEGSLRIWSITPTQARPYIVTLGESARKAFEPDALCVVNDHCNNCRARHACPALQGAGLRAMDYAKQATPFDLPPHALGIELGQVRAAIKALEARETGLAGQAEALIKGGTVVPFWHIDAKPGNLAWMVPAAEVFALGDMLKLELRKPPAPITPTQAKDRGLDPVVVAAMAERPPGKPKLVRADDATARKIFS